MQKNTSTAEIIQLRRLILDLKFNAEFSDLRGCPQFISRLVVSWLTSNTSSDPIGLINIPYIASSTFIVDATEGNAIFTKGADRRNPAFDELAGWLFQQETPIANPRIVRFKYSGSRFIDGRALVCPVRIRQSLAYSVVVF